MNALTSTTIDVEEMPSDAEAPDGQITDYISGRHIPAKPEELLAVQPFAR